MLGSLYATNIGRPHALGDTMQLFLPGTIAFYRVAGMEGIFVAFTCEKFAGHVQVGRLPGWRFAFLTVAALSFLIGAVTFWLGQEPRKRNPVASNTSGSGSIRVSEIAGHMLSVMRVPTFGLLVAQVSPQIFGTSRAILNSKEWHSHILSIKNSAEVPQQGCNTCFTIG